MIFVLVQNTLKPLYSGHLGTNQYILVVSSFQGVGFHSIQRCPHFRGLDSTLYRGVLISGGWNRGVPLYTEVSSFQRVGIEGFHCIQGLKLTSLNFVDEKVGLSRLRLSFQTCP